MGILDDAIREHLELKRQHGADNEDLQRLEKEAFGPATRPGDPEFDTSESEFEDDSDVEAEAETRVQPEAASEAPPSAPEETGEQESSVPGIFDIESGPETKEEDWLASLEDVVEQPATEQPAAPPREPATEPESGEHAEAPSPAEPEETDEEDVSPAERARIEHPDLGDTVSHPTVPEPSDTREGEPATDERGEPPEAPESSIFDGDDDFGDLDLELDIEEAEEDYETEDSTSTEMDAVEEPQTAEREEDFEADDEDEDELEDEDEDLLNETPDFLQDAPEGDRLWFEQGEPKDFDFDDD